GAFVGDTIRTLLRNLKCNGLDYQQVISQIVAFEPDPTSYERLARYVAGLDSDVRNKIELHNQALAGAVGQRAFAATGSTSSRFEDNARDLVACTTLDQALGTLKPTYLKMDIEGAELEALTGATATIARCRPHLAVCIYHRQDHLWRIPLLVPQLHKGYRLFIRRHGDEFGDVVCYAVPQA
ncbi:MAG: FkbM family methyltransferase, partial [candidate division WOR-3 bacterium]